MSLSRSNSPFPCNQRVRRFRPGITARSLLIAAGCALAPLAGQGAVIVSENFDYADGSVGGGEEGGGVGWTDPWSASSSVNAPPNEFTIQGGRAIFTGNDVNQEIISHDRGLAAPLTVGEPDTVVIAFDLTIGPNDGQLGRGIAMNFRNGGANVFTIGKRINSGIGLWADGIGTASANLGSATIGQVAGTTYTLATTITYNGSDTILALSDGATTNTATLAGIQVTIDTIQLTGYHRQTTGNGVDNFSIDLTTIASNTPPSIVTDPVEQVAVIGGSATFLGGALGGLPLSYQWRSGGVDLPGETNDTLFVTGAGCGPLGPFDLVVTNGFGSATSLAASLSVVGPAVLPAAQLILTSNPAEFRADVAPGAVLSYQWRKEGVAVPGATGEVFSIAAVTVADNGGYDVIVSCGSSTVTSDSAQLIVPNPTTQPYDTEVLNDTPRAYWRLGEAAGATVAAEEIGLVAGGGLVGDYGTNTLAGEAGVLLGDPNTALRCLGETNSVVTVGSSDTLGTLAVNPPFSVEIWAQAEGGQGTFRSPFAYVDYLNATIIDGWSFFANSQNRWEFRTGEGSVNSPDTTAWNTIVGPPVVIGEWAHLVGVHDGTDMKFYVNGALAGTIPNAVFSTVFSPQVPCTIGGGSAQDGGFGTTGDYWIGKVDEPAFYGSPLSADRIIAHYAAAFPLDTPPSIDTQPQDQRVLPGLDASFSVAAASPTPLTYQWQYEGGDLAGGTNRTLALPAAEVADAGDYRVIVANATASVTSDVATLTVVTNAAGSVLSVNIVGFSNPGESIAVNGGFAGVPPYRTNGWNEVGPNATIQTNPVSGLVDGDGTPIPVSLTWNAKTNRRGNWVPLVDGDHAMLTGFLESRDQSTAGVPVTLTISNIPPAYTSIGYDVFVYMAVPAGAQAGRMDSTPQYFNGSVGDGSRTYYYHGFDHRAWTPGDFRQATETNVNAVPADANYAVFEGLTASTLTLTVDAHPVLVEGPASLCGFQIVAGRTAPPTRMGITREAGSLIINWTANGVLQTTTDINGWNDVVPTATSPYTVPVPAPREAFRLREP